MKPRVAVLVLNYNGLNWLKRCLPSVFRTEYANLEVWIIDNGSSDGSIDFVKTTQPNARILEFEENLGFAEAYNRAIALVRADYVVLLNNDTIVLNPGWIDRLLETVETDNRIAGVQSKLVSMNDQTRLDSVGGIGIRYWLGFTDIGKLEADKGQYDNPPVTPFYLCAACALINRQAFLEVGGFDPEYFVYVEDVDLSWRLRLAGYRITYQPTVRIAHFSQGFFSTQSVARRIYLQRRNLLRTLLKNCGSNTIMWAVRNFLLHSFLLFLFYSVSEPLRALAVIKSLEWNIGLLPDTLRARAKIQRKRQLEEKLLLRSMYPPISYRPLRHQGLYRVLALVSTKGYGVVYRDDLTLAS
jgi:hypothetical protein